MHECGLRGGPYPPVYKIARHVAIESGRAYSPDMMVSPRQLLHLAATRRREPWNWTAQFCGIITFSLGLFLHSYVLSALALALIAAGFLRMELPPMSDSRWHRFVLRCINHEKNWLAFPMSFRKGLDIFLVAVLVPLFIHALWTRDLAILAAYLAAAVLLHIRKENRDAGIDP
ncbi:hypothetical protein [Pseudodesulfovibrio tunisiensis]|uniref:hypothetical protein n=1 Tax=Pseudodesulfovibrio tunisiensis TaxID=463192 RepID=UPI001FB50A92|nr:hypothetical protein [Pseudodesulfovibrio tunisiensis]